MEFSEKLSALLSLTATKNISLAKALNIDTAQISRMKTGARKMPAKPNVLYSIAEFLSERFDSEYRLSALYELTNDSRLHANSSQNIIAIIIYEWLISPNNNPKNQEGRFFEPSNELPIRRSQNTVPDYADSPHKFGNRDFIAYYNNEGKRQAVRGFITYLLSLSKPCTIRVFTDEDSSWLLEDQSFTEELSDKITQLVDKGFQFQRIQPPSQTTESVFRSIERWMPLYMAGVPRLFYYPWSRDELHRRTIIVAPGHIAMHSDSLCGQKDSPMTILTSDIKTVQLTDEHYSRILERCKTMMNVYTAETSNKPIERLENISKIDEFTICKASRLSVHTFSSDMLERLRLRATPLLQKMLDSYKKSVLLETGNLKENTITDILCMPDLDDVVQGRVPIPGTKISSNDCLYYTLEEYKMHLEHILHCVNTYPNYKAIILNEPMFDNVSVYIKGCEHVLLIKENTPFSLYEITESGLAASLCEYLKHSLKHIKHTTSNADASKCIKKELLRLKKYTVENNA